QSDQNAQIANQQGYDAGYQAGLAEGSQDNQQAYNSGYQDRAQQNQTEVARAFDNGYDTGAAHQAHADDDWDYP
ncbi:MAG TPA: hypothetical protein VMU31_09365, partial [Rhizomicrobium sp.]|nr:hypothetical protein [Rhizomicrobium sp.]